MTTTIFVPDIPKQVNHTVPDKQTSSLSSYKIAQIQDDQFISALAHEIRNPLTNINLAADMLQSTEVSDDQQIYLDIILRASVRVSELVNNLLIYSPSDDSLVEKYAIRQMLEDMLVISADRIELKNIMIKKSYTISDANIFVNKASMKIGLTNILSNAIDATTAGNGEITLMTRSMNGMYIIEIKDNGMGIKKENLKKIFDPYFTNKPGGLGLGLSTCKN